MSMLRDRHSIRVQKVYVELTKTTSLQRDFGYHVGDHVSNNDAPSPMVARLCTWHG